MIQDTVIRSAHPEDAERLLDIYSYYVRNTAISFEWEVPSPDEFRNRVSSIMKQFPYLVALVDDKIVGYAYAHEFIPRAAYDWCCELTIYLDPSATKRGIGKSLYAALEEKLRRMGYLNLYACIGIPDTEDEYLTFNSARFHEHLGFRKAGTFRCCGYKFGRWYHMIWMEKWIGAHRQNAVHPITEYAES